MKSSIENSTFITTSEKVAFDKVHREKIKFNMSRYDVAVDKGLKKYSNLDIAREIGRASCRERV